MKSKLILCLALILSGNCFSAIVHPKAPDGGRQMVAENTGRTLRGDSNFFGGLRIEDLTISEPHREYYIGLTNLASGHLLSGTTAAGWRFLLLHGSNAVGVATLIADGTTGKVLGFNSLQKPFHPNATVEALRAAEKLPQIKKQDHEVRFLGIPSVNFMAIWLHGKSDDIIIPLPPTFGRFNDYQPYSESQIIKALKKDAANVMKQPNLLR